MARYPQWLVHLDTMEGLRNIWWPLLEEWVALRTSNTSFFNQYHPLTNTWTEANPREEPPSLLTCTGASRCRWSLTRREEGTRHLRDCQGEAAGAESWRRHMASMRLRRSPHLNHINRCSINIISRWWGMRLKGGLPRATKTLVIITYRLREGTLNSNTSKQGNTWAKGSAPVLACWVKYSPKETISDHCLDKEVETYMVGQEALL
jgi:hypothetical protein